MTYKAAWYPSPIELPQRRHGKLQLRHRTIAAGLDVNIVGQRQALLRGMRPVFGKTTVPLRIHELVEDDHGIWMTDLPEELNQIAEMLHAVRPKGSVLVGGLGLGLVAAAVAARPGVRNVVVVERSADVIALCARTNIYGVVERDIGEYLVKTRECFDYYLLDTWQGTSEGTWWEEVLPLRRTIRRRFGLKPAIHCWAEDIMLGQIVRTLTTMPPHWYYGDLKMPMNTADADRFVRDVGLPAWERQYGAAVDGALRDDS
ncbi:MAG: hypothetical protein ACRD3C_20865 [Vicinamibacterales bacterium]